MALTYLWLVAALPLAGAIFMALFGRSLESTGPKTSRFPGYLCTALAGASFAVCVGGCLSLLSQPSHRIEVPGPQWFAGSDWGLLLDPLSAELSLLISGIGTLIHIYSIAYMKGARDQYRYFGGLNFFVAVMQLLVLADNYLLLFAGWEGVGFASYLLIGFEHHRWEAGIAAMKAFVINRAADAGFILGILFLLYRCGSTQFGAVQASTAHWTPVNFTLAASLLLVGAIGKSAQIPLHIWLPDAMQGPTPVSALIHSATMVCAGVYLVARSSFIFSHAPEVALATAIIGSLTALIAATIALAENDIKRVLAYSTVSQIGFMFLALGAGAYTAALFHLFTHAFFKSLLFLGAGSVIHALDGDQNLKHMGGLRKLMPKTFSTMLVAVLALAGIPGFAGYFSKDLILGETFGLPNGWLFFLAALVTSLLTAFYAGRLMFLAFWGKCKFESTPHEAGQTMLVPMYVLAVGCVASGWVFPLIRWSQWPAMLISAVVSVSGIWLAWHFYITSPGRRAAWDERFSFVIGLLRNRWYIDALYEEHILNGVILRAASLAATIDSRLVDNAVNGVARSTTSASSRTRWVDRWVIDGLVRFTGGLAQVSSSSLRALQTGRVQTYALLFVAGLLVALSFYLKP